ncbi:active regulator of SIRT1-like [Amphiura filiformis]|uniref:active regulator of SIRT1-like n=1 Tax=Amphiura filiformis TaxID=82378 RepID=UPI003B225E28
MSAALVRKGLELLADEDGDTQTQSFKKRKKGPSSMKKDYLMKRISTDKQGVKKQLRQLKRKESTRNKPTVMGKNIKSAIDVYYSRKSKDLTEHNVKSLLKQTKVQLV